LKKFDAISSVICQKGTLRGPIYKPLAASSFEPTGGGPLLACGWRGLMKRKIIFYRIFV
jgi:hypothetical protein